MAEKVEKAKSEESEKKIPVFTVLKNNTVLKNIFLLASPPSFPETLTEENGEPRIQELEETLLVGRHPDCNITLEHPSISRFHLRIHSNPSFLKLSIIDLSSVHGTMVSGKKIEPGVRVELNEGDTMQLGCSSRVYRLHWVPLNEAYHMDNPFLPPQMELQREKEEDNDDEEENEEEEEESYQDGNNLVQSLGENSRPESMDFVFSDENSNSFLNNVNSSAPPLLPNYINSSSFSGEEENKSFSNDIEHKELSHSTYGTALSSLSVGILSESTYQKFDEDNKESGPSALSEKLSELKMPKTPNVVLEKNLNFLECFKLPSSPGQEEAESLLREDSNQRELLNFFHHSQVEESVNSSLASGIVGSSVNHQQLDEENTNGRPQIANPESSLERYERNPNELESSNSSLSHEEKCYQIAEAVLLDKNQDLLGRCYEQREIPPFQSERLASESICTPLPRRNVLSEIESKLNNESKSPGSPLIVGSQNENEGPQTKSAQKSKLASIWSRRGKPLNVLQIQPGRKKKINKPAKSADLQLPNQKHIDKNTSSKALFTCLDGDDEEFTPGKENFTTNNLFLMSVKGMAGIEEGKDSKSCRSTYLKSKAISKVIFSDIGGDEEPFTPDKENITPNALLMRSLKKVSKKEENNYSDLYGSLSLENNIHVEGISSLSVKEKQAPKVLQEQKMLRPYSKKQEKLEVQVLDTTTKTMRLPFQPLPLPVNSSGKSGSEAPPVVGATMESNISVKYAQTIEDMSVTGQGRRWSMVVDATCLLEKESRKALQLLQGLKGTQLIIPRIVIRELGCMKRQGGLFRRRKDVCVALEWVEECLVNTNWWIHVQSSEEEGRPIALTPPASPQSNVSECAGGAASSVPFSAWGRLLEIVSPTAEDHILECALMFRRLRNEGHLVILTNDVTLKIKAMAEGFICETAEGFRESLVNPFSERFLWTDSSPRGLTWSCADDIVLREKYYSCHSRKPLKSGVGAKGLKLILLHNSRYAKNSVS